MNLLAGQLAKLGVTGENLDYNLVRGSMVIIYASFGYDKWFESEIKGLVSLISHGPLIFWMIPAFGVRGTGYSLGTSEWTFGLLLFLGFWNKRLGLLGALRSCFTFIATVTILPFAPGAWEPSAGGFPAMTTTSGFLLKDLALLAASFYLLRQEVLRIVSAEFSAQRHKDTIGKRAQRPRSI